MSDQRFAEVDQIVSVSRSVREVADFTESAAAYSVEADPDMTMWGGVGLPFGQIYSMSADRIHGILGRLPDAFSGLAQRIEDSAKSISESDDGVKRSFDELNSAEMGMNDADG
ncbi:hypothetical protein AB0B28_00205 [Glycomyces sp. NPDC046736]|uniref:hypothetical protein n=1 Tax=Glycomyces sp. NPDC046736 TaxID=3155615 RepID=UPI0033EA773D